VIVHRRGRPGSCTCAPQAPQAVRNDPELFQTASTPGSLPPAPVQRTNGAPLEFQQRPELLGLRYRYMAPRPSLSCRRVARACRMEGPGFSNAPSDGLTFALSIVVPSYAWRGVSFQSRSTPAVRTRRLYIRTFLHTDRLLSLHRLLHDVSVYSQTAGKHDSDAARRLALLDFRRRLELFAPLVREHASFQSAIHS
jgi:hypothetical protein